MARGAWQATVHGVAKSWIRLSTFFLSRVHCYNHTFHHHLWTRTHRSRLLCNVGMILFTTKHNDGQSDTGKPQLLFFLFITMHFGNKQEITFLFDLNYQINMRP